MDRFWKAWTLSLLALSGWGALVVMMMGCAHAPVLEKSSMQYEVYFVNIADSTIAGQVICDTIRDTPIILIDSIYIDKPWLEFLMVHEVRHVEQVYEHGGGSCLKAREVYNSSPGEKLKWEMEAECAEMLAQFAKDPQGFENALAATMNHYYRRKGFPQIHASALAHKFRQTCEREKLRK